MTDILPPVVYSPLVIVLPGIKEDALLIVQGLLLKGTADKNEKSQEVFEVLFIEDAFARRISWECKEWSWLHQDSTVKSEIDDEVEQEEGTFDIKWKGRVDEAGNSADLESRIWESEKKEIVVQNMLNQRKKSMKKGH